VIILDKQAFINTVKPYAIEAGNTLGIDPNYIVAHWAHETGYGTNTGFTQNNLAGIMAYNGSPYGVNGKSFSSLEDFTQYYTTLLKNSRYNEGVKSASTVTDFAKALKNGGYASDPNYAYQSAWNEAYSLSSKTTSTGGITLPTIPSNATGVDSNGNLTYNKPYVPQDKLDQLGIDGKGTDTTSTSQSLFEKILGNVKYGFALIIVFVLLIFFLYGSFIKGSDSVVSGVTKVLN
jgi:hypothetical protein